MPSAISEAARVLKPGARFCLAIVHPINSAGTFAGEEADSPFVIAGSYLEPFRYTDDVERGGLAVTSRASIARSRRISRRKPLPRGEPLALEQAANRLSASACVVADRAGDCRP